MAARQFIIDMVCIMFPVDGSELVSRVGPLTGGRELSLAQPVSQPCDSTISLISSDWILFLYNLAESSQEPFCDLMMVKKKKSSFPGLWVFFLLVYLPAVCDVSRL